jgi:hypothetical protein
MKYYQIGTTSFTNANTEDGDEYVSYAGISLADALEALENEKHAFKSLHEYDKKRTRVWGRIYDIPDETDINDEDEVLNAIIEAIGYDELEAE